MFQIEYIHWIFQPIISDYLFYIHLQGTHEASNFYFDNDKFTIPHVYGEYMAEMTLAKDDEKLTCLLIFYDIVPKTK